MRCSRPGLTQSRFSISTVTLLPAEENSVFELKDDMEWQTIEIEQPAGELEAIELRVDSVYAGSKYADLCLSDVETHVTSRTPENPEFEKRKLQKVLAWKQERLDAAKLFREQRGQRDADRNGLPGRRSQEAQRSCRKRARRSLGELSADHRARAKTKHRRQGDARGRRHRLQEWLL